MKKILFTFLTIYFISNLSCFAQIGCWNNPNTITTKWDVAGTSNTENWNWTMKGLVHPVYLKNNLSNPSIYIELPYFCSKGLGSGSCNNGNTFQYEILSALTPPIPQDIYPENGWELIMKDFGTPNPVGQNLGGVATKNPVFILYNKYTGRMKTYLAIIGQKTANSAYLQISFTQNSILNSVYAHATAVSKTLLEFEPENKFKSLNDYSLQNFEEDYQWMVSEIQTNYDPCMCASNSINNISSIEVRPFLILSSDIDANIEGTLTQKMFSNMGGVNTESSGKTSFLDMTKGAAEAAIKGYNDYGSYKDQLNKILDDKNSAYKNKLVTEWFDDYVKKNPQYQGVSGLVAKNALWDNLGRTDDAFKRGIGIDNIGNYQNNKNFTLLKSIAGYVPYVGTAIGIIDFFMNGGKEETPPKPSPPMVFNVSLSLTGTIKQSVKLDPVSFQTPGYNNQISNLTPIYNNILGVFNILKPAEFKAGGIKPNISLRFVKQNGEPYTKVVGIDGITGRNVSISNQHELITKDDNGKTLKNSGILNLNTFNSYIDYLSNHNLLVQYQLNEDLKYILNPSSNLSIEMIDACFVLEYKNGTDLINKESYSENYLSNKPEPAFPFYPSMFAPFLNFDQRIEQIAKRGLDLEFISLDNSIIKFRTKYVPLSCLKNVTFTLYNGTKKPNVYVKMLIKYKRKDKPESELITQIVTYDVSSKFNTPIYIENSCEIFLPIDVKTSPGLFMKVPGDNLRFYEEEDVLPHVWFTNTNIGTSANYPPNCLPFYTSFITPYDVPYYNGLQNGLVNGTLKIPNNSIIPSNTFLKAKSIVFGNNITINNNVELVSESDLILPEESTINPNAILRVEPFSNMDLWNCPDVSVTSLQATDEEISEICNNSVYKNKAGLGKTNEETFKEKPLKKPLKFELFPNPARNMVSVIINGEDEIADVNLSILDLTGKVVLNNLIFNQIKNGTEINIDVSSLANGVYFINLNDDKETKSTKKLIIAK